MKDAQTILSQVQQFFSELVKGEETFADTMPPVSGQPEAAPVKMMDAKLKDGTLVQVTELAVGGIVTIAGAQAPVGEHMLEDGTIIVVGDNGAIMEIKPAEEAANPAVAEEPPMMEDMSAKFAAFESATNEKFQSYEEKFAQYEGKLTQANKVIEGLMQISKMLVEAPQAAPDSSVKTSNAFATDKKDVRAEFAEFSKSICS
jgi:hypothetical protein